MSTLDALVSLISTSVVEFSTALQSAGLPLPDLSASVIRTGLSEDARVKVARAVKTIEAACAQLVATVADPGNVILNKATAYEESACLQVALDNKIADHLLDKPEGVHVSKLASTVSIDGDKLSRILRLLATGHVFREVQPDVWANNRLSLELTSTANVGPVVDIVTNEQLKSAGYLNDYLKDPDAVLPFERIYGLSVMEFFTDPEFRERREVWAKGVANWIDPSGGEAMHKVYPWAERLSDTKVTTICDIGAGNGHVTLDLMREFESKPIRAVVQDLPPVLEMARSFWEQQYPKALTDQSISFVPINFFEESPVDGCDYYYIRFVLHNWSDELFVKILENVAKSMKRKGPECRLLIHDITLDHPVTDPDSPPRYDEAPWPLLPNFGASRYREFAGDLNMMILMDAKERSSKQMMVLVKQAGLVVERIYPAGDSSIMELKLA